MTTSDTPAVADDSWLRSEQHRAWLTDQATRLLRFFRTSLTSDGRFVELDDDGRPMPTGCPPAIGPQQNLLTVTRAVHCYALGEMLGIPGCRIVVDQGLQTLWDEHRDPQRGGYVEAVGVGGGAGDSTKAAYGHAFVLLAATSALAAGHAQASALADDVLAVIDERFWSESDNAATAEAYDRDWNEREAYRGANSNMHLCECLLAAAEVLQRRDLADRALRLAMTFIDGHARRHGWLLPEHYDTSWEPMLEYNRARLDDPFRPYGATVGHSLEWSRLVVCAGLAGGDLTDSLMEIAETMFDRAMSVGWDVVNGGLVYTVDWSGAPANPDHYWWPVAEGIATAAYLLRLTGDARYEAWYRRLWEFAAEHLIDHDRGGWFAMLDQRNQRKVHPWYGKPDIYHALGACLLSLLPVSSSMAGAVRRRPPSGSGAVGRAL